MLAVITLLFILALSFLLTRIATVALVQTGLTTQSAKFQARSAFTGVGFTTRESEQIMAHPVRRRAVMLLMLLGRAAMVLATAALLLAFIGEQETSWSSRVGLLAAGLVILWIASSSAAVERELAQTIHRTLQRWSQLDERDRASLLRIHRDFKVAELHVESRDWLAGQTLQQASLGDEGVQVLGIYRADGTYVGVPCDNTRIGPGDVLLIYGRDTAIDRLDDRRTGATGDQAHEHAVAEQRQILAAEHRNDALRRTPEERRAE